MYCLSSVSREEEYRKKDFYSIIFFMIFNSAHVYYCATFPRVARELQEKSKKTWAYQLLSVSKERHAQV